MSKIIKDVSDYYNKKVSEHGRTHWGVDWNSNESQELRFDQLLKVVNREKYSLMDYGCGFGSLLEYMVKKETVPTEYIGFDVADEMLKNGKEHTSLINCNKRWVNKLTPDLHVDFIVASGIFNVMQDVSTADWEKYILTTLNIINSNCTKGFSFNVLTSYSDKEFKKDYLYYADSLSLFDYCKKHFSRNVALLHDYDLYEFTIIVRK